MGGNVSVTLSLLSLGPERQVNCYNGYFINGHVFHTREHMHGRKTYNNRVCVKGDYHEKLEEVIELQYHSEQIKVFLFTCYWYDTTER